MTRSHRGNAMVASAAAAALLMWVVIGSPGSAAEPEHRSLADTDRKALDDFLGQGVVGAELTPPLLPHGLNDLISFGDGVEWRVRIVSGPDKGKVQKGSAAILNRKDGDQGFRLDTGDGRNTLFGEVKENGDMICHASQDLKQGVVSHFSPGQPIFLAGMSPGETRRVTCKVSVADLSRPDRETHAGKLDTELTYVGAYRVSVPAGKFDAVLMKTHLSGKVGPASVEDTIYRFYAKNVGLVAQVEATDISAVLVYQEKARVGKVLVEKVSDNAVRPPATRP